MSRILISTTLVTVLFALGARTHATEQPPLAVLSLLLSPSLSVAQSPTSATGTAEDRAQITSIVDKWERAWNTHDMAAYAALYHDDGVWVLWTGNVWSGKQAIEDGHAAVHKTIFRNSTQRELLEELTFIGSDAAIVRFCSVLTGSDQAPDSVIRSRKFLVVTKRQGQWKVSWGQNTRLQDTVPDSECFTTLRKRIQ
jgi:uncharacterized protein (TIGR02246 family)